MLNIKIRLLISHGSFMCISSGRHCLSICLSFPLSGEIQMKAYMYIYLYLNSSHCLKFCAYWPSKRPKIVNIIGYFLKLQPILDDFREKLI